MGGENFFWEGTPLIVLYEKHIALGKSNDSAIEDAAKDLGWLVKSVLSNDKRTYTVEKARSEERRVGKECLWLCRSRWSPYH